MKEQKNKVQWEEEDINQKEKRMNEIRIKYKKYEKIEK